MSTLDIETRKETVARKLREMNGEKSLVSETIELDFQLALSSDTTEEQKVASYEGLHDYLLMINKYGVNPSSISFDDFLRVRSEHPGELLSFSTGKRRNLTPEQEALEAEGSAEHGDDFHVVSDVELEEATLAAETEVEEAHVEEEVAVEPIPAPVDDSPAEDGEIRSWDHVEPKDRLIHPLPEESPGSITFRAVEKKEFLEKRGGYEQDVVDNYFDDIADFLREPRTVGKFEELVASIDSREAFPRKKGFNKGFDADEVDNFINAIKLELLKRIESVSE